MSTIPKPTAAAGDAVRGDRPDPETVTISGYVVDESYGPETIPTADPKNPNQPHDRIGKAGA